MIRRARWSLLPSVIAGLGLVSSNLALSSAALAQAAMPPAPPGTAAPPETSSEPPARVGWLSNLSGAVSFHSAEQNQWTSAAQNYPFATGDALWTEPQAQAAIMIDASKIALNGGSEFTAQEIDATTLMGVLSQGEAFLDVVALQNGQSIIIDTPRGTARITTDGQYEIYVGDTTTPSYITVVSGSLQFTGLGQSSPQTVNPQQTLVVSGSSPVQTRLSAMQQDEFLTAMLEQIAPPPPPSTVAPPPVVTAQMTGASVLSRYGNWQSQPSAGAVWFPQEPSGWVPYRDGRWAYIQPWGWTWVDNAPWGFAPFHYGRWAEFGGRWGWVPAPAVDPGFSYQSYHPVYAPALVTFLGAAVGALTAAALTSGSIGWAPLGLREPYYPPYSVSERYFRAYNRPYIQNYNTFYQHNVTVVNNHITYRNVQIINEGHGPGGFNHAGATFVPVGAMMASRPIASVAHGVPAGARIQPFHPGELQKQLPRPSAATWGVTPAMAARQHLPAGPGGVPARRPAPGPAIRPMAFRPGQHAAPPPLVAHAAQTPQFHPGAPAGVHGTPMHAPMAAPVPHGAPLVAPHGMPTMPPAGGHAGTPVPGAPAAEQRTGHAPEQFHPAAPHAQEVAPHPQQAAPHAQEVAPHSPQVAPHPQQAAPHSPQVAPHPQQVAPHPQQVAPHPQQVAPHPQQVAPHSPQGAPHPQQVAPHPQQVAPHPAPREAPHPAPRPAPHEAPHQAPRPAPHEAPHQAPRPAPHEAPHQAPHEAPHQAPHPAPHEAPQRPPQH